MYAWQHDTQTLHFSVGLHSHGPTMCGGGGGAQSAAATSSASQMRTALRIRLELWIPLAPLDRSVDVSSSRIGTSSSSSITTVGSSSSEAHVVWWFFSLFLPEEDPLLAAVRASC